MKIKITLLSTVLAFAIISCATKKTGIDEKLYTTTWELDYISGSRIGFNGLYPDKKPEISFNKETGKVSGNNSCNGYLGDYILKNNFISFGEPETTTMMFCGEGEKEFLNSIKKVNKFSFDQDGKLNLMKDDVALLRFKMRENK